MQLKTKTTYDPKQPILVQVTAKDPKRPDPEVPETKPRRRFTAKYKLGILGPSVECFCLIAWLIEWLSAPGLEVELGV
jgi:hypothetical protein